MELDRLRRLLEARPLNAAALARALGVSVPTVMRGLRALRERGVPVRAVREGGSWHYVLRPVSPRAAGLPGLPRRRRDAHKGDYGRVLLIAGSYGMAGAAALAGRAAYRAGAGLVQIAAPSKIYDPLAAQLAEAVILPLHGERLTTLHHRPIREAADRCDVAAIGCGLGTDPGTVALVSRLLAELSQPVVLDADGLNALARHPRCVRGRRAPLILTPHEGEMGRLMTMSAGEVRRRRSETARRAAKRFGAVVLLKGYRSVITDGRREWLNPTGNPGMATAGSGDVLTGIIAALLGQGLGPLEAARLGTYLHGRAGDLAAAGRGEVSLIASDIIEFLPRAITAK